VAEHQRLAARGRVREGDAMTACVECLQERADIHLTLQRPEATDDVARGRWTFRQDVPSDGAAQCWVASGAGQERPPAGQSFLAF
jgi:hypothetical protein